MSGGRVVAAGRPNLLACERCGRPHESCKGHSKRHGGPCGAKAVTGQDVCYHHGGGKKEARANGIRRRVQADAANLVFKLLHDPDAPPVDDPLTELAAVVGRIGNAVDVLGGEVNRLERLDYTDDHGTRKMHVVMEAYRDLTVEYRRALTDMVKLGIEDRVARLQERYGEQVADLIAAILDAMLAGVLTELGRFGDSDAEAKIRAAWPVVQGEVVPALIMQAAGEDGSP